MMVERFTVTVIDGFYQDVYAQTISFHGQTLDEALDLIHKANAEGYTVIIDSEGAADEDPDAQRESEATNGRRELDQAQ